MFWLCVYRIFFHPFARYPGPWLAKVSNLYAAYHAWLGDVHIDMWRCHQQYGDTVRYAPDRLLVNTAEAVRDIYGHRSNVQKSKTYEALVHRAPNILTTRDRRQHGRKRRVMSQALSDNSIATYEPAILEQVDKFVAVFTNLSPASGDVGEGGDGNKKGWSTPLNVSKWCDFLTFDIMAKAVFSANYDMLGTGEDRAVLDAILASNVRMGTLYQYPALGSWKLHKHFFPAAISARSKFIAFVSRMVGDRLALAKASACGGPASVVKDVFGFLAKAKDPETGLGLSPNELAAESTTLIVAGSDTTSTSIAATLFYLAKHAAHRSRARAEVRTAFPSKSDIKLGPALSDCAFLAACINEAMRLSPPVGASLWREALEGGIVVDGRFIPAGYDVGVGLWSMHHSEKHYAQPFEFVPERWMAQEPEARENLLAAFGPFSRGARSCSGKGLATAELLLTLARVLWEVDFRLAGDGTAGATPEGVGNFDLRDHVTGAKDGPVLQFQRWEGDI